MALHKIKPIAPDGEFLNKNERIEKHLMDNYEMRYNLVKGCLEYREKGIWSRMRDRTINSISRALEKTRFKNEKDNWEHLSCTPNKLFSLLDSDLTTEVDPIKEYLTNLKPSENGSIARFASCIKVADWYSESERKYVETYFKKWFVGTVANALNDDNCYNHLCIVLVGEQGLKKGFLIEELLPKKMREYIKTDGNFDPRNKDSVIAIAQYMILHLDDMLRKVNLRDYNEIKNAITRPDIKVRKSYGRLEEVMPHRASFIATVNDKEFITDLTGSRRFMPFELASIDWKSFKRIDMSDVWSEALHLYQSGYEYWVSKDEENTLNPYKQQFMVEFSEEGLLTHYFMPYNPNDSKHQFRKETMTTTMILQKLTALSGMHNLSDKKLGALLKSLGFVQRRARIVGNPNPVRCYDVVLREHGDGLLSEDGTGDQ
jgi:predicted P-loop ATPase